VKRLLIVLAFCLLSLPAFAAGGACPSSSNYLTSSGTLTTLSALGITSCYYFADSGSDSNTGTDETHPFLHAPQMPNCSANCATLQNTPVTGVPPGTGLIFKGGDTWHFGNSSATPYAGGYTWAWNSGRAPAGTSSHPIYVGVDQSWFSGGSWTRPILTEDNPPNASTSLGSCTYAPGAGNFLDWSGGAWAIVDNFEMTGVCTNSSNWNVEYVSYGGTTGAMNFYNLYIHGWSHVGFPNPNNCTASTTCLAAFEGSVNTSPPGETLLYDVVDGSDSDPVPMQFCYCGAWRVAYSYFNNGAQFITRNQNSFHDSAILNFVDNGHANVMEGVGDAPGASNAYAIYNNLFGHLYVSATVLSNVCFWPYPSIGATLYWFNNIVYDGGPCELYNMGQNGVNEGTIAAFSDIFQLNHRTSGVDNFSCSATSNISTITNGNNHYITDDVSSVAGMYASNCAGLFTDTGSVRMSNATATSDGYTSSQTYVFSPTSAGSPTVGAGNNRTSTFCAALTTASGTDSYLTDAATKCKQSTGYASLYNASTHTITATPALTPTARPSSGAWDQGAYEYPLSGSGSAGFSYSPNPVAFGNVNVGSSGGPTTVTITNTGTASLVIGTLGNPSDAEYSVSSDLCSGQTVSASGTCTIHVTFTPTTGGSKPATISVPDNAGNPDTITLSGTGVVPAKAQNNSMFALVH
jgi:Abnormal spindle-like microcephaly-assoc'd, ASPM-SPD-2-Hydin